MRACERKGASTESERDVRSGRPIRRGQTGRCMRHADEWTYAAEGAQQGAYRQQRVPSRAPNGGPETAEILA